MALTEILPTDEEICVIGHRGQHAEILDTLSILTYSVAMGRKTYTTKEAAAAVGITRATVQAWISAKKIRPPKATVLGNIKVRMWNPTDLKMLREAKKKLYRRGRGRKPGGGT